MLRAQKSKANESVSHVKRAVGQGGKAKNFGALKTPPHYKLVGCEDRTSIMIRV